MNVKFTDPGWADYIHWQGEDRKTLKKINQLISSICRGDDGIGKPEILRGDLSGWVSRRIDEKNRLVYRFDKQGVLEIAQCKGHYGDR
jgi:toxin YoeB